MQYLLIVCLLSFFSLQAEDPKNFTLEQRKEIEQIVHDYILNYPEILAQAVEVLRDRQYQQMQEKAVEAIKKLAPKIFAGKSPFLGNKEGPLYIVEFIDYNCPHCRLMYDSLNKLVSDNKDLKLVIKEYPVLGDASVFAAKAALAADKQGKFKELHDAFMSEKVLLDKTLVMDIANNVGLNVSQLQKDMEKEDPELADVKNLATNIGIQTTPSLIVATYPLKEDKKIIFIPGGVDVNILQNALNAVK